MLERERENGGMLGARLWNILLSSAVGVVPSLCDKASCLCERVRDALPLPSGLPREYLEGGNRPSSGREGSREQANMGRKISHQN